MSAYLDERGLAHLWSGLKQYVNGKTAVRQTVVTLRAAGWAQNAGGYTQSVAVGLVTSADTSGMVGVAETATDEQWAAAAGIRKTGQTAGWLTFRAARAPAVDIPVAVQVMGG